MTGGVTPAPVDGRPAAGRGTPALMNAHPAGRATPALMNAHTAGRATQASVSTPTALAYQELQQLLV